MPGKNTADPATTVLADAGAAGFRTASETVVVNCSNAERFTAQAGLFARELLPEGFR